MPTNAELFHARRARAGDAAQVVPLLVEAIDHLALQLAGASEHMAAWPLFAKLYAARGNRYSHQHALVLERAGEIAAVALAYPGAQEAILVEPVLKLLRRRDPEGDYEHEVESAPDEFYLDALAVAASQRGQGLAVQMIEAVYARAIALGQCRVGLLVDHDKPGVQRLYERLGFAVDGERLLAGHRYRHLSRLLTD